MLYVESSSVRPSVHDLVPANKPRVERAFFLKIIKLVSAYSRHGPVKGDWSLVS